MKVLFLIPYPVNAAPSQRFRFEQYFKTLKQNGFEVNVASFFNTNGWNSLYQKGKFWSKFYFTLIGIFKRFLRLYGFTKYDYIFIHRGAMPVGPPTIEYILTQWFKKKVIYDFDDAIWLSDDNEKTRWLDVFKYNNKVQKICKWSYKVSCGNKFLADYARKFNKNVVINPTTIDTENYHNPDLVTKNENEPIIIGWTGSHSTLKYLDIVIPALKQLENEVNIEFRVIANKDPQLPLACFRYIPWNKSTEIKELSQFDIGLMPLVDDIWVNGKCGFKALQYLAMEIPTLVSPVGVNRVIIEPNVNGYFCESTKDWCEQIKYLINHPEKRKRMGRSGRIKVINNYSVNSNSSNFLGLFN